MLVTDIVQEILDTTLLQYGILSHHLHRTQTDAILGQEVKVNNDEYVVYRLVSSQNRVYGDGNVKLCCRYIDINYYYNYNEQDGRYNEVVARVEAIKKAFMSDKRFRLKNGESDLFDIDNPYRGINIEVAYLEALDNE